MRRYMFYGFIALLLGSVVLTSCNHATQNENMEADTITVSLNELKILLPDDSLKSPVVMTVADDNILVVNWNVDTIIDRFSLDGKYIDSFLRKGQGPNEVMGFGGIQYAGFNHDLYINDEPWLPLKVITDLNAPFPSINETIKLEYTDSTIVNPQGSKIVLANGSIVAKNNNMAGMLAIFRPDHKFEKLVQPYPPKSEFGEGIPDYGLFNFYPAMMGVSPEGNHFVVAYSHGDMLAFGELRSDTVAVDYQIKKTPKGVVIKNVGGDSFAFEYNDEWKQSYGYPALSNKHAYIPYYGEQMDPYFYFGKSPEGLTQQIRVYDFRGKHIRTYLIPDFIAKYIAVTPDDSELFILNEDPDAGYRILKLDLKK